MLYSMNWDTNKKELIVLNQRKLPATVEYLTKKTVEDVFWAIKNMEVRGAPLIGVVAAYGVVIGAKDASNDEEFIDSVKNSVERLKKSRPTAVNLFWALERMYKKALELEKEEIPLEEKKKLLEEEAKRIHNEDIEANKRIGELFIENKLIEDGDSILTHCNAGALATTKYGTATSAMYLAKELGWNIKVFADETRPYLQGARLTTTELKEAGIDVTLICDNMAGWVMKKGMINKIIVGADRIAANGDVANKIGTMSLAILAKKFNIPFYVAAPTSTIDLNCETGEDIPIEERDRKEVTDWFGIKIAPDNIGVFNPAFDVTPNEYITAIVTEKGIIKNPKRDL